LLTEVLINSKINDLKVLALLVLKHLFKLTSMDMKISHLSDNIPKFFEIIVFNFSSDYFKIIAEDYKVFGILLALLKRHFP